MRKNEADVQFALLPTVSRWLGWSLILACGFGFAVVTLFAVRIIEQLLSFAFAFTLLAIASRMLWMLWSIRGLRFEDAALVLVLRNTGDVRFTIPDDVTKVSRFGPEAKGEIIVELKKKRRKYCVVTSHYERSAELRRVLADKLHFEAS